MRRRNVSDRKTKWTSAAADRLLRLARGSSNVDEAIAEIVLGVLDGLPCPPTDLNAVARRLNVARIEVEAIPVSGMLRKDADGFCVMVSADLPATRRRFTIAHEFGHVIFEGTGPNCPRTGRELEALCDMIASEMLMPRRVFGELLGTRVTASEALDLARRFGTSVSATARRIYELKKQSLFAVRDATVEWGYGLIRTREVGQLESDLRRAIIDVQAGTPAHDPIYVSTQKWRGLCDLLSARFGDGFLFSLHPCPRR